MVGSLHCFWACGVAEHLGGKVRIKISGGAELFTSCKP
jgi:hypothetical protein